jgi:hypothetical protein
MSSRTFLRLALVVAAAAAVAATVVVLQRRREVAIDVTDQIEGELADLDPVTRAAVVGRLAKDTTDEIRLHLP